MIMEQLGGLILSNTITNQTKEKYRLAARGIIAKDDNILMIYCRHFNDYTFPGGGVENGEDEILALYRECEEEAGVKIENIRPFYKTFEKREIDEETVLLHESHFYLCDVRSFCKQKLETYEVELGYEPVWISVSDAIEKDENKMSKLSDTDYKGVLERELLILYKLKELMNN